MSSKAQTRSVAVREQSATSWLWVMLAAGFVLRFAFMGNSGFQNDVASFESWALTLAAHPLWQFYGSTSFADYPPGYFYVLWIVGHVFQVVSPHGSIDVLKYLVKLPAVLVDLADGVLLFYVVRRFATEKWALGVAALFIFNPAIVFISASWGQVDSISSGLALLSVLLLIRAENGMGRIVLAWAVLACSLLIKPQAAILIPLFVAFAFSQPECRRARLTSTVAGVLAALAAAFLLTVPFHPTLNPVDAFAWLYHKYSFGKDVYAYNSVNAFNLWGVLHGFWSPDSERVGPSFLSFPQYVWALALVIAAAVLTIVRYLQSRTDRALLESAAVLTLAFFVLSTRMHERYIYDGLVFTMAAIPFGRRYLWSAIVLSFTLFINLFYSMQYLSVVTGHGAPGVNAQDLWGAPDHLLSAINVLVFFYLGFVFLGQNEEEAAAADAAPVVQQAQTLAPPWLRARTWFNPREGLGSMIWPLDYVVSGAIGIAAFIVSYVNYWLPTDKIFDEIYFARAAEEYLKGVYIYENTHPPLTKLIITFSTILFGGLHGGDNSHGWRFLDVVFGAVAVVVLYAFAKRLTRSTLFSAFAAILFTADGMHFVQSRIATPEGIVVVFSIGTMYAFYRYWIASQSTVRLYERDAGRRVWISLGGALVLGLLSSLLLNAFTGGSRASTIVGTLFLGSGWYLLMRLYAVPRLLKTEGEFASYADGSRVVIAGGKRTLTTPDGRTVGRDLVLRQEEATVSYRRDGSVEYATPEGSAVFTPGQIADDQGEIEEGRHATGWLIAFTLLLGALVASKWYGVMAYPVSFVIIALVWSQRYWAAGKCKRWGNPFGFRLDVDVAAIVFLSMLLYVCVWIPDMFRHIEIKSASDLIYRQYTMFEYHDTLKATHPYMSSWWQWPLDARPIAYYWHDYRSSVASNMQNACCVAEIMSLPNPIIMWFGLVCVPIVAWLAYKERNKGYLLLVLAYLFQWLPWADSPRITFAYHFYVDIPIIILCNVIVLQRLWNAVAGQSEARIFARIAVGGYVAVAVLAFIWFYPILAGIPIRYDEWQARMLQGLLGNGWV